MSFHISVGRNHLILQLFLLQHCFSVKLQKCFVNYERSSLKVIQDLKIIFFIVNYLSHQISSVV